MRKVTPLTPLYGHGVVRMLMRFSHADAYYIKLTIRFAENGVHSGRAQLAGGEIVSEISVVTASLGLVMKLGLGYILQP